MKIFDIYNEKCINKGFTFFNGRERFLMNLIPRDQDSQQKETIAYY